MSPLDRRHFLRGAFGALLATAVGCTEEAAVDAGPSMSPGGSARHSPSPSAVLARPTPAPSAEPAPSPSSEEVPAEASEREQEAASAATEVEVICRDAWDARAAGTLSAHTVVQLTLHHTAVMFDDNREAPARLRQHQRYHQSRGWPDIAYHLGVDRHGHVYELRRPDTAGDTATDYDPAGHFLVVALGHFDEQQPTAPQLEGVARAFAWGAVTFDAPGRTLTGHREHAGTSCPGDALQARLPEVRARIAELASGGIARRDVCGEEAERLVAAIAAGSDEPLEA
ncbi:MAG: N-acetylmuramoyl-L-alanine amidase [Nitriliruptorales bacterium]|nr:N-acetylmuramoyl-L-alanine amidase [Nitriliruptorales bacterium]